jgi:GDP-L-fucose synthase
MVARIVGYDGAITWDSARPDGTPRKLLDVTRLKEMGWSAGIDLEKGIRPAYEDYLARLDPGPGRSHG